MNCIWPKLFWQNKITPSRASERAHFSNGLFWNNSKAIYLFSFVFIKLSLRNITCTVKLVTSKIKVVFTVQTATDKRLPVIYYRKVLKFGAYVNGTQFSAATSILIWEPITSQKSETAIPRNIDGSRIRKTISGSRYWAVYIKIRSNIRFPPIIPNVDTKLNFVSR